MIRLVLLYTALALSLIGCAGLQPSLEKPTVSVSSFRLLPSPGLSPRFEIGLHIVNPNRQALELRGVAYTVNLDGHKILTGVANQLPTIAAYGEGEITLQATASLLNGVRVLAGLMQEQRDTVAYQLDVRLDVNNWLSDLHVSDAGQLSLSPGNR